MPHVKASPKLRPLLIYMSALTMHHSILFSNAYLVGGYLLVTTCLLLTPAMSLRNALNIFTTLILLRPIATTHARHMTRIALPLLSPHGNVPMYIYNKYKFILYVTILNNRK
jgi:hypothetical protein